jgi:hypothetical protein
MPNWTHPQKLTEPCVQPLKQRTWPRWVCFLAAGCLPLLAGSVVTLGQGDKTKTIELAAEYGKEIRPLLTKYCLSCHSTKKKKGDLDLERFGSVAEARKDLRVWQHVQEMLETGEMPPKKNPQPRPEERRRLVAWVRGFLDAEARARAGDPGRVVVRRLSNAEYNHTVRDLTGIDLQPARDFPADGAAGEGFTNTGDALVMSPTLLLRYLKTAKEIAAHAVLLPDGFRFSTATTRRDWTDQAVAELRSFYAPYSGDGKLPLEPYLSATVRHRDALAAGTITLNAVAAQEKLHPKYSSILWQVLNDRAPSFPLDEIRARWRALSPKREARADFQSLLAEIAAWQAQVWRFVPIGSYRYGNVIRQLPNNPAVVEAHTVRLKLAPAPGQNDVVLYLTSREIPADGAKGKAIWQRPRFEGGNQPPLLLRDYATFGSRFEIDYGAIFAGTPKYLTAAVEAALDPKLALNDPAAKRDVDAVLLERWIRLLALEKRDPGKAEATRWLPAAPLVLLDRKMPSQRPAINGWVVKGADLPVLITNSSDKVERVPGTVPPHRVAVHPTPTRFVAAAWKSPLQGRVRVAAKIIHAHPACGNGVAWWLEHRRADRAAMLADGLIDLGKATEFQPRELMVQKGDLINLAIDPRDAEHTCDLTEIALTVTEIGKPGRVWDLARDIADNVLDGNPHADRLGNKDVWHFVHGPARKPGVAAGRIPQDSVLARWRRAAFDPKQQPKLALEVHALLTGKRPVQEKHPDRILYDTLLSLDGPLLQGLDLARLPKKPSGDRPRYGLETARFGKHPLDKDAASLVVPATSVIELRLPAPLFRDRDFVVEGQLDSDSGDRAVQFQVLTAPPKPGAPINGGAPCVASGRGQAAKRLLQGLEDFRRVSPIFIHYARVIPDDEVVCLKLYHREDEPLIRLFLDDAARKRVDRLWDELRFISRWPVTEHEQLPQFIGYVTQDQPKELVAYFESQREPFRRRAQQFQKEAEAAIPKQLEALVALAAQAYRRPLEAKEKADLLALYDALRNKKMSHEEAFRTVLTRMLISPSFLFRIERAGPGTDAQPVSDWELATRLSYFLWATMPDAELRRAAADGRLRDPKVLAAQTVRMLKDPKVRGLAVEFGAQWLHVRDIRQNREKNEKLFPTFNDDLRTALFEETALFFQDLFQNDGSLHDLLDADYTFLNDKLASHYGIPGVAGPQWRRVTGVKKYGRGGVLALGSVLATQSGASRTSPVLRGNWLVETLLGEKLPKPPPNVPRLPEEEATAGLTVRQLVERHARVAECAVCHQRIDPFGFALERYDPIGRLRDKDLGGRPVDVKARLKDGTTFEGLDGLRTYLLNKRGPEIHRHFCQKLLGYSLGRAVTLSDQPLLDEMLAQMKRNDQHLSAAVLAIVESRQFRYHRGVEATRGE